MSARKKQRTTRSSARAAAAEVELLGAGTAHVSLSRSDARKAPVLAAALDEKRDAPRVPEAPAEALERLKEFLRRWDGGPLAPAPPWLAPLLDAPPAQLVDLCAGAAALGLTDLVRVTCAKLRPATATSSPLVQEQEYARLIDTANAPIFGVDSAGKVDVWNRCASRLMGFPVEEVMGKHLVNEFITP
eukprot:CAMPEP_0119271758 /NCGR_PEP_ID=MMETSP1329-20130426/8221_1 /TAXON_ID=114041 /ORGANISM="Genus nov. species nov., Strain RCC1024" /LENGTH=187 /DNA_ID=CAMNT_0007271809 /DNA_START=95 /DNA_END=655 /DNA_ORIENTATION=+